MHVSCCTFVLLLKEHMPLSLGVCPLGHWEIKGRFRKRVVLANVLSFRFSFRGKIRQNHPFGNHPFVNTKKAHWEIKGRFPKGWFWRMYPRSGFCSGGTSAKTTLLETTLLRTPDLGPVRPVFARVVVELWAADPSKCPRKSAASTSWGTQSEAPS